MTRSLWQRLSVFLLCVALVGSAQTFSLFGQARRVPPTSDEKKNKRPTPGQEKSDEKEEQPEPLPTDIAGKDTETVKVSTNVVNVDAVVYNKKSGQITTGLTKKNFEVYVDGVKRDITNFSTQDAPITMSLVVEYSKLSSVFGYHGSSGQASDSYALLRPTAYFMSQLITPQDYV